MTGQPVRVFAADLRPGDVLDDLMRDGVRVGTATVQHVGRAKLPVVGEVCVIRCYPTPGTLGALIFQMPPDQSIVIRTEKAR